MVFPSLNSRQTVEKLRVVSVFFIKIAFVTVSVQDESFRPDRCLRHDGADLLYGRLSFRHFQDRLIMYVHDNLVACCIQPRHCHCQAVTGNGLSELKDLLWKALNSESNKITAITQQESIVHRNKDLAAFHQELLDEGEDEEIEILDDDFIEDVEEEEEENWTP